MTSQYNASQRIVAMRITYLSITEMNFLANHAQPNTVTKSLHKIKRKITKRDQKMHRLIFMEGGLPENTKVYYKSCGQIRLTGRKQGRGIFCDCCTTEVSASQFEAHAGMGSRRKPYENIFVSNEVSLHQYASYLKLISEHLQKENDKVCSVCVQSGDLLPCDGCCRSFHTGCMYETRFPLGLDKWFCDYCFNSMKCVEQKAIIQIAAGCVRIVNNPNKCDLVACAICRTYDFTKDGFNDRTVIVCDQCEKEYHVGCLRQRCIADLREVPHGNWFCCEDCKIVHSMLKIMVWRGPQKFLDYVTDMLINMLSNAEVANNITGFDFKWILIRGKNVPDEHKSLHAEAVNIFDDQFNPIIDTVTDNNFITSMAYGLPMGATDFSEVHCAILVVNSRVVAAGMIRAFGKDFLELPIAATNRAYQGRGYFNIFYDFIEKLAGYLKIRKIMIPAAEVAKRMWIEKYGFRKVTPQQLCELRQTQTSMVAFKDTTLLEKDVPEDLRTYEDDNYNRVNIELCLEYVNVV